VADLERSHAELRAALLLAGKKIRKLNFGRANTPTLALRCAGDRVLRRAQAYIRRTHAKRVYASITRHLFKKLKPVEIDECPFTNLPEKKAGRWGAGLTAAKMEDC
jgi:hypothetical protein